MDEMKRRQIRGFVYKQKKIIKSSKTERERAVAFGLWAGFITGLKMTGAITPEEYEALFAGLEAFEYVA